MDKQYHGTEFEEAYKQYKWKINNERAVPASREQFFRLWTWEQVENSKKNKNKEKLDNRL
jgi:hypothetical protein